MAGMGKKVPGGGGDAMLWHLPLPPGTFSNNYLLFELNKSLIRQSSTGFVNSFCLIP
jgi:hypothetical protein